METRDKEEGQGGRVKEDERAPMRTHGWQEG